MSKISNQIGEAEVPIIEEDTMAVLNEGINQVGLAAAVAKAAADGSLPAPSPSPSTSLATSEDPVPRSLPSPPRSARLPPPPMNTSNVTRVYGGRGGPGRGRGSSQDIRSRLLSRLGIYGSSPPGSGDPQMQSQPLTAAQHRRVRILRGMGVGYNMFHQSPPDGSATRIPLSGLVPSKEPLKSGMEDEDCDTESIIVPDDSDDEIEENERNERNKLSERGSSSTNRSKPKQKLKPKTTKIAFQDHVEVMPIPTRHEFSNRIKSRIWSNRYELQENAERNAVEFASEGWNWRNVTEDEGMYICSVSGELVHPAWVGGLPTLDSAGGTEPAAPGGSTDGGAPIGE